MLRIIAAIAASFTCLLLATPAGGYEKYAPLNGLASWLAGRSVSVHCLTSDESVSDVGIIQGATAYVDGWLDDEGEWHPKDHTVFAYGVCESLMALKNRDAAEYSVSELGWALLVLTHESGHLRGYWWSGYEDLTEVWALRHVRYAAWRLGFKEPESTMLLAEAVKHHNTLPEDYRSPECRKPSVVDGKLIGCKWKGKG